MFALLLGVWGVTYWLYNPGPADANAARITTGKAPATLRNSYPALTQIESTEPPPVEPMRATPIEPLRVTPPTPEAPKVTMKQVLIPPKFTAYKVQKGDTSFEAISRRLFKDARYATAIAQSNPYVTPNKLIVGKTELRIPEDPTNIQGKLVSVPVIDGKEQLPDTKPSATGSAGAGSAEGKRTYKVQSGDTLSSVSKKFYGKAGFTKKIADANKSLIPDPDRLKVGIEIVIPE